MKSHSEKTQPQHLLESVIFGASKVKERDTIEMMVECMASIKDSLEKVLSMLENVHKIQMHQKKQIDRIREFVPSIE